MRSWGLQTLKKVDKSPNEFAMKTVNEYLNETTRPTDGEENKIKIAKKRKPNELFFPQK